MVTIAVRLGCILRARFEASLFLCKDIKYRSSPQKWAHARERIRIREPAEEKEKLEREVAAARSWIRAPGRADPRR
jgi:hypothetical protein